MLLLQAPGLAQLPESAVWAGTHHQTLTLDKTQRTRSIKPKVLAWWSHQLSALECLSHHGEYC